MSELSPRKREILRRVVEEYVASGQPVGSRTLVERANVGASPSTVRGELAELEALGLLMHPHTSAGRVPTEHGYRFYAEELVDTLDGNPGPSPIDLSAMRGELEQALQQTTEALSQATRLLALVTAPSLHASVVRHVEILQLQPRVVLVVVITSSGGVTKRMVELDDGVDPGLVDWALEYLNETVTGLRLGATPLRRRLDDPGLDAREREFLAEIRPVFDDALDETGAQFYVGGAAGLLGDVREDELEACQHLLQLLERRAVVLELLSDALEPRRAVVRVGPKVEGAELKDVSYVGATYGLSHRTLGGVGLLGPLRMDYEKAIRVVRAAALELSRLVDDVYDDA
jgi:heat-inducible transcriptional repressor